MTPANEIMELIRTVREDLIREIDCLYEGQENIRKALPSATKAFKWGSLGGGIVGAVTVLVVVLQHYI